MNVINERQPSGTTHRKTWKVLNPLIGHTNNKNRISDTFIVDNIKVTDVNVISSGFGLYGLSVGNNLAESMPKSTNTQ